MPSCRRTKRITFTPRESHTHTIIILYGGDRASTELVDKFADEFFEMQATDGRTLSEILPTVRWVFPIANMGNAGRFDKFAGNSKMQLESQRDALLESATTTLQVIHEEALLVPMKDIILADVNQGCATAIFALLCGGAQLGGLIGHSSCIPFQSNLDAIAQKAYDEAQKTSFEVLAILERGRFPIYLFVKVDY